MEIPSPEALEAARNFPREIPGGKNPGKVKNFFFLFWKYFFLYQFQKVVQ
jgi:hypothetical protein